MNRLLQLYTLLLCTIVFGFGSPPDSLQVFNSTDSVLVIANRYQSSLKNIASSYAVIDAERIRATASHSVLQSVEINFPSAFVLQKNTLGYGIGTAGAGILNLRGLGGKPNSGVLILLNGHPDFMGIFGHPLPDAYGMDDIQQVEVLAGPGSTLFGSNAMGGVINIVNAEPNRSNIQADALIGSYHTSKLQLKTALSDGIHSASLALRHNRSEGHTSYSSAESIYLQGGASWHITPHWKLNLSGRYVPFSFDDRERAGREDRAGLGTYARVKRTTGEIILKNAFPKLQGSIQVYGNSGDHRIYDGFHSTDFTLGLSAYQYWQVNSKWHLAAGMDLMRYGGQAENPYLNLPDGSPLVNADFHKLNSAGLYGVLFYQPLPSLNIKTGLRYQTNSLQQQQLAPMAALTLDVRAGLRLFANYQSGYRTPTLMELYLFPTANDKLHSEQVDSYEGGISLDLPLNQDIQISYYHNYIHNRIQSLPLNTPPPAFRFVNSGSDKQWGTDLRYRFRPLTFLSIQLAYSYLDAGSLTAFNPGQQFKYQIAGHWKSLHALLFGRSVYGLYASNNHQQPVNDYHEVNLSLRWQTRHVNPYLRVQNLFNRQFEYLPGYPAPGRQLQIGLQVTMF